MNGTFCVRSAAQLGRQPLPSSAGPAWRVGGVFASQCWPRHCSVEWQPRGPLPGRVIFLCRCLCPRPRSEGEPRAPQAGLQRMSNWPFSPLPPAPSFLLNLTLGSKAWSPVLHPKGARMPGVDGFLESDVEKVWIWVFSFCVLILTF